MLEVIKAAGKDLPRLLKESGIEEFNCDDLVDSFFIREGFPEFKTDFEKRGKELQPGNTGDYTRTTTYIKGIPEEFTQRNYFANMIKYSNGSMDNSHIDNRGIKGSKRHSFGAEKFSEYLTVEVPAYLEENPSLMTSKAKEFLFYENLHCVATTAIKAFFDSVKSVQTDPNNQFAHASMIFTNLELIKDFIKKMALNAQTEEQLKTCQDISNLILNCLKQIKDDILKLPFENFDEKINSNIKEFESLYFNSLDETIKQKSENDFGLENKYNFIKHQQRCEIKLNEIMVLEKRPLNSSQKNELKQAKQKYEILRDNLTDKDLSFEQSIKLFERLSKQFDIKNIDKKLKLFESPKLPQTASNFFRNQPTNVGNTKGTPAAFQFTTSVGEPKTPGVFSKIRMQFDQKVVEIKDYFGVSRRI